MAECFGGSEGVRYAHEVLLLESGLEEAQANDPEKNRKQGQGLSSARHVPSGPGRS